MNRERNHDGDALQWILGETSTHLTHHVFEGQYVHLIGLQQNKAQTGSAVIEETDEVVNA